MDGQFVEVGVAGVVAGVQGEVDEGGAGQQDGAGDGVVGEPGLGVRGEPSGEEVSLLVGQVDGGGEQGVCGVGLAEVGGSPVVVGACSQ